MHDCTVKHINIEDYTTVPDLFDVSARVVPNQRMLIDPIHGENVELSYSQFSDLSTVGAASMQSLGLKSGQCVSMFAENSYRWLVVDQAIMKAGAHNSVRGASAPMDELNYIFEDSGSMGLVVENLDVLRAMAADPEWKVKPAFVIVLWDELKNDAAARAGRGAEIAASLGGSSNSSSSKFDGVKVLTYEEFILAGGSKDDFAPVEGLNGDSTATVLYTSGTTSKPKGVVLSHNNLLHQVKYNTFSRTAPQKWDPAVGDTVVSILPCWHIYERTSEYYCFARGAQQIYSNLGNFKKDLASWKPHFLFAVPRLFETIYKGAQSNFKAQSAGKQKLIALFTTVTLLYKKAVAVAMNNAISESGGRTPNPLKRLAAAFAGLTLYPLFKAADALAWKKVRTGLGGRLKVATSGGSLLPMHIESFFRMVGLNVIVGYGLTESSPIICSRMVESNVVGSVGEPGKDTEVRVVNPDSKEQEEVPRGKIGLLKAKGPSILRRYNNNPDATAKAIDSDGFFDTGDLGRLDLATGSYVITGRFKDTIVLSNGENVAPQPIEDRLTGIKDGLVDQAMLVGQDKTFLTAICVMSPAELRRRGLVSQELGVEIETAIGATPLTTGPAAKHMSRLRALSDQLNADAKVVSSVMMDVAKVNEGTTRAWERIGKVVITLEPFSVANDQLTQTLKVKRDAVASVYASAVSKVYASKREQQ
jgi:long-chain acyl-CoA synthetase